MKTSASRIYVFCFMAAAALFAAEFLADYWLGDGNGIITNYNLHGIILIIQWILLLTGTWFFIGQTARYLTRKESRLLPLLGKAMLLLVYLIFLFILAELLSRIIAPAEGAFDRMYPAENARHPYPYVMFKGKGNSLTGFGEEVYNEHGYRGKYPVMPKPSGEFRVIMLGGSAVWEGDTLLTTYFQAELQNNLTAQAQVYNFGVVSANSSMQFITLVNEVALLEPDLIVCYDGANDVIHPLHYDPRPGYPFNFLIYENNPFFMKSFPAFTLLAYKSNLFRLIAGKYLSEKIAHQSLLRKQSGYMTEKWRNEIMKVYLDNIRKTISFVRLLNARSITFLQPTVYSRKNLSDDERKFVQARAEEKRHAETLYSMISAAAKTDTIIAESFVNLSDVFDSTEKTVFRDNVHVSNEGRRLIAKRMTEEIIRLLKRQGY